MANRLVDEPRLDRIGDGVIPFGLDVRDLGVHADTVDLRIGGDGADHDGHVVFAPAPVGDVGEQEGLALRLVHAADELPAHQRVQFGILVDRPVDGAEQAPLLQDMEMLVKIAVAARHLRHVVFPDARNWRAAGSIATSTRATTPIDMGDQTVSGTILMAPQGHSVAHSEQPLQ